MTDDSDPADEFDFGEPHEVIAQRVLERAQGRRKPFAKLNFPEFADALANVRARYIADSISLDEDESKWAIRNQLNYLSAAFKKLHTNLVDYDKRNVPGWLCLQAAAERVNERQEERSKELKSKIEIKQHLRRDGNLNAEQQRNVSDHVEGLKEQLRILEQDRIFFEAHKFSGTYFLLERAFRLMHLWTKEALKSEAGSQRPAAGEKDDRSQCKQEDYREGLSPEHRLIVHRLPALYIQFFRREGVGTSRALNEEGQPSGPFLDFVMAVLTEFDIKSNRDKRFSRHTVANLLKRHQSEIRVIAAPK